jgi:hypothetical protein
LLQLVKTMGSDVTIWPAIASHFQGRSMIYCKVSNEQSVDNAGRNSKQCRERYSQHLTPDVNKQPWSAKEEQLLFRLQATIGNAWTEISRVLPGRSDATCKNRYYRYVA